MVQDLHAALLRRPDAPDATALGERGSNGAQSTPAAQGPARRVVAVEGAELFHRPGCSMVAGKDVAEMTPAAARKQGLRPCPACSPVGALTA